MGGYPRSPSRDDTDVIGARIGAQIIDSIAMFIILLVPVMLLSGLGGITEDPTAAMTSMLIGFLIGGLGAAFYAFLLEGYWDGQTLGKRVFGIKVVEEDGDECGFGSAFVRNLPAFLLLLSTIGVFFYSMAVIAGFIAMAISDRRQRIFDRLAGSVVVREAS